MAKRVFGVVVASVLSLAAAARPHSQIVYPGPNGKLVYKGDERGDTVLDFSNCGYMGGGVKLPDAPVKVTLSPENGATDDTARIQAAIDEVAKMPADGRGIRGAVLLKKGKYVVPGTLRITTSGVVLRGEGKDKDGTLIFAAGTTPRNLIEIKGKGRAVANKGSSVKVSDAYVPVGARTFGVADGSKFKAGDAVIVTRVGNKAWISEIGMDQIKGRPGAENTTRQWEPFNLEFDRVVTKVEGDKVTIDAPIACAIDEQWGGGSVAKADDSGRIEQCGVENLWADSAFDPKVTKELRGKQYAADEKHATYVVEFENVKNAWARDIAATHFYNGTANAVAGAKWVTVQDCSSVDPVSEITGGRRYPFSVAGGQLILYLRCYSREDRHAFVVGSRVCGPNAFVDCVSEQAYATSEPHHRWSVGGLYDNVKALIAFQDRQWMGSGHGWSGANYVAWNCEGSLVCQKPPTAQNYAIGFVGKKEKGAFERADGHWESQGKHVEPRSLYMKQLEDRLGAGAVKNVSK